MSFEPLQKSPAEIDLPGLLGSESGLVRGYVNNGMPLDAIDMSPEGFQILGTTVSEALDIFYGQPLAFGKVRADGTYFFKERLGLREAGRNLAVLAFGSAGFGEALEADSAAQVVVDGYVTLFRVKKGCALLPKYKAARDWYRSTL